MLGTWKELGKYSLLSLVCLWSKLGMNMTYSHSEECSTSLS